MSHFVFICSRHCTVWGTISVCVSPSVGAFFILVSWYFFLQTSICSHALFLSSKLCPYWICEISDIYTSTNISFCCLNRNTAIFPSSALKELPLVKVLFLLVPASCLHLVVFVFQGLWYPLSFWEVLLQIVRCLLYLNKS